MTDVSLLHCTVVTESMVDDAARGTVRYAHPGHDRIARESLDLRQRENELRGRWKEMGFQLPQVSVSMCSLRVHWRAVLYSSDAT